MLSNFFYKKNSVEAFNLFYFKLLQAKLVSIYFWCDKCSIRKFLADLAALLVHSVSNFSRAHGADASTCDSKSYGRRCDTASRNFDELYGVNIFYVIYLFQCH